MIQKRSTFFLGIFIFLIPFLGIPSSGKTMFTVLAGLLLIAFSIKIVLPHTVSKKIAKHHRAKKEKVTYVPVENTAAYPEAAETKTSEDTGSNNL